MTVCSTNGSSRMPASWFGASRASLRHEMPAVNKGELEPMADVAPPCENIGAVSLRLRDQPLVRALAKARLCSLRR